MIGCIACPEAGTTRLEMKHIQTGDPGMHYLVASREPPNRSTSPGSNFRPAPASPSSVKSCAEGWLPVRGSCLTSHLARWARQKVESWSHCSIKVKLEDTQKVVSTVFTIAHSVCYSILPNASTMAGSVYRNRHAA